MAIIGSDRQVFALEKKDGRMFLGFGFKITLIVITDYMQLQYFLQRNSMQGLFYYASLLYTPLQLPSSALFGCSTDPTYIIFPLSAPSPSLLELPAEKGCPLTTSLPESEDLPLQPVPTKNWKKRSFQVKSRSFTKEEVEKQGQSEQFIVKEVRGSSGIIYKKKNTESNIVNQTFAFLSSERSKTSVSAFFKGNVGQVEEYYRLMTRVKQVNKKYINRKYLKRLLQFSAHPEFQKVFAKAKINSFTIECVERMLRVLTYHFLRQTSVLTLLTSSKIYKQTLPEHFWRKREIMAFLFEESFTDSTGRAN